MHRGWRKGGEGGHPHPAAPHTLCWLGPPWHSCPVAAPRMAHGHAQPRHTAVWRHSAQAHMGMGMGKPLRPLWVAVTSPQLLLGRSAAKACVRRPGMGRQLGVLPCCTHTHEQCMSTRAGAKGAAQPLQAIRSGPSCSLPPTHASASVGQGGRRLAMRPFTAAPQLCWAGGGQPKQRGAPHVQFKIPVQKLLATRSGGARPDGSRGVGAGGE